MLFNIVLFSCHEVPPIKHRHASLVSPVLFAISCQSKPPSIIIPPKHFHHPWTNFWCWTTTIDVHPRIHLTRSYFILQIRLQHSFIHSSIITQIRQGQKPIVKAVNDNRDRCAIAVLSDRPGAMTASTRYWAVVLTMISNSVTVLCRTRAIAAPNAIPIVIECQPSDNSLQVIVLVVTNDDHPTQLQSSPSLNPPIKTEISSII